MYKNTQFLIIKILYLYVRLQRLEKLGRFAMLMAFWEVVRLKREIHTLERQAMETRIRLSHYQKYAGILGATSVMSFGNIAGLSPDIAPRASLFAQYSNQASTMSAMQALQTAKMNGMIHWTGNPLTQQMYETSAFNRFKEESLKALKQQEVEVLNEKEAEIQLELSTIETRLKEKRAMLESTSQLLDSEVKESAPKFGL